MHSLVMSCIEKSLLARSGGRRPLRSLPPLASHGRGSTHWADPIACTRQHSFPASREPPARDPALFASGWQRRVPEAAAPGPAIPDRRARRVEGRDCSAALSNTNLAAQSRLRLPRPNEWRGRRRRARGPGRGGAAAQRAARPALCECCRPAALSRCLPAFCSSPGAIRDA